MWAVDNIVFMDGTDPYIAPAFIGGVVGAVYLLVTGFLRLLTSIGGTEAILIRSKNAVMKVVNKLNGSEDL